jgi:hypothetical protein
MKVKKREKGMRKPSGILLPVLGLSLFAAAAFPVRAQTYVPTTPAQKMLQAAVERAHEQYMFGSGRNQRGEALDLNTFNGRDMSPEMGVPGARLAREAYVDIYAHNYNGAIPLLQKAIQVGNEDAMLYLSYCNFYGFGVPVDRAKALQLQQTVGIARQRRAVRRVEEAQAERARAAKEFERAAARAAENAEAGSQSQSSTYRSSPTSWKIKPFIPPSGPPFGTTEKYMVVPWGSTVGQGE